MIQNPILKGFCPDPSIVRVGEDYYIACSTFEWWPGVKLFHSKDLNHFEQIPSPLVRMSQLNMLGNPPSGGIWAPDISYDGELFWLVFTDVKTKKGRYYNNHNYVIWTDDIYGEWSEPVYLNSTGFDPSMFHSKDGKKYLVNMKNGFKGILIQEFDPKTKKLVGEAKNVFPGTEIGYTEGPHIYYRDSFYYLMVAEGGTGYDHCVTMARSNSIWGPYEVDPKNPMLTSIQGSENTLQKCGHGDLTDTQFGEWYLVHLCARPPKNSKRCTLGRETAIQKVVWNNEGWLRLAQGGIYAQIETEPPTGIESYSFVLPPIKDEFESNELGIQYVFPRIPLENKISLEERKGFLRIYGQESLNSNFRVSLVAVRQTELCVRVETEVEFFPMYSEQVAGLTYMYDSMNFYLFVKSKNELGQEVLTLVKSDNHTVTDQMEAIRLEAEKPLHLRIETQNFGEEAVFSYSTDGETFQEIARESTEILTDEHCKGFTGAHFGMYCHDMTGQENYADFSYFEYQEMKS